MNTFFRAKDHTKAHFKPFGKWDEAAKALGRLEPDIKYAALRAQELVSKQIYRKVKAHLRDQDLPWKPLNSKYSEKKQNLGMDPRILIMSGSYYHAIHIWKRSNGWQYFVGVKKGEYGITLSGKRSRLPIASIAAIHEFSSNAKRKRPLWNPTIREMGNTPGLKKLYLTKFANILRRRGLGRYITRLKSF